MAETENIAPATAPEAPVAAPEVSAPVPGGDTSALAPATQPSEMGTSDYGSAVRAENTALNNVQELSKPTPPAPPVPHARLLAMVHGLAVGLGAAATSMATGGREGGAAEVTRIQGEEQQQKIQAKQAVEAQKNTQIQQQLMVADTNHKLSQNILLLATLPDQIAKSHLELKGAEQAQDITGAEFQAAHGGMGPKEFSAALNTTAPIGVQPDSHVAGGGSFFTTAAQQQYDSATRVLGADDTYVKKLQATLTDPNATPKDLWAATDRVKSQLGLQEKATEAQTKKEAAAAGARPKDLNDATGRLTQAQQEYKTKPTPENKTAVDDAKAAQQSFLDANRREKQIAQDIQNGDPAIIGKAMANATYAPSQVLSARSMSKPFYSKVVAAANEEAKKNGAPEILGPHGEHTGDYFNAAKAEGQFKYATNIQTQNTLNKILTLNQPGGDLDILKDAITGLPKLDSKTINKIFNAGATEFGSPAATNYHMALYNLASLLAQVQTGGIPTEGEIDQQLGLMNAAYSKGQLDGALQVARKDIAARGTSMVANNPYLRNQYPEIMQQAAQAGGKTLPAGVPVGSKLMQVPGYKPHWMSPDKIAAAQKLGATEVQ